VEPENVTDESVWGTDKDLWPVMPEPLVPSRDEIALYRQICPPDLLHEDAAPRILVLGVTPPLVDLRWPRRAEVHAVDFDQVMVSAMWAPRERAHVHVARWQDIPLSDDSFDLVIGDCSFNALPGPDDYEHVLREVARVSRPGAPLVSRFFVQSEPPPQLARIAEDASGALAHLRAASKRLLVALACAEANGELHMSTVTERIRRDWGDFEDYLVALGDSAEDRDLSRLVFAYDQRLNYPTERDIRARFAPYYSDIRFEYPDHDVGAYCPIVRFA
jgi:SAM-dependent methyltransferase